MSQMNIDKAPDPIDIHVGLRVKQKRIYMGLSQTKLGMALGVSFQQVQKYENGSNRISASTLYRVAETLGVDIAYFFDGLDSHGPGLSESHIQPDLGSLETREEIELMKYFSMIENDQLRRQLFQFVRTVSQAIEEE